ncbi:MAG: hypothetical protein GF370_04790 [Candidatus Nealsonbacteria bacterium]|nr:hypothetical protein [Candidatus Nealsonbacteria bacterium]
MKEEKSCRNCGYKRFPYEQPCKVCLEEGYGGLPLWEEETGEYDNFKGKIFKLNRELKRIKKDTLVKVVIVGNSSCKVIGHPSGLPIGKSFSYGWLDPVDNI